MRTVGTAAGRWRRWTGCGPAWWPRWPSRSPAAGPASPRLRWPRCSSPTLGTVFDAASFAVLPQLVPPPALPTANARLQAGTAVAGGLLGAPLAGLLFAVSASLPFTLDALTFAAAALLVLALRPAPVSRACACGADRSVDKRRTGGHDCAAGARRGVWREAWTGCGGFGGTGCCGG